LILTPEHLYDLLSASFPTCFYDFSALKPADRPSAPPYCAILEEAPGRIPADNKTYYQEPRYTVELYVTRTDYVSENTLEQIFSENEIYFDKDSKLFIRDENKILITYHI
jgi:hypothetical protein